MSLTQVDPGLLGANAQYTGFKNRIINGAMMVDQRNAGASVTPTNAQYLLDRFQYYSTQASKFTFQQNAGAVTPPVGFTKYLGMTVASAVSIGASDYFLVGQKIEGYNIADLAWGTANAKAITISFQIYSSVTGTFGGCLYNNAGNRGYPFTYVVSSANTWTSVFITIPGDVTGTWLTDNGNGFQLYFGLGVGSSVSGTANTWGSGGVFSATGSVSVVGTAGAVWYMTGLQVEKGSTATSFDYRPYGTELALCQRYYSLVDFAMGVAISTTSCDFSTVFPVQMRVAPSVTMSTARVSNLVASDFTSSSPSPSIFNSSNYGSRVRVNGFTGMTAGLATMLVGSGTSAAPAQFSSEL